VATCEAAEHLTPANTRSLHGFSFQRTRQLMHRPRTSPTAPSIHCPCRWRCTQARVMAQVRPQRARRSTWKTRPVKKKEAPFTYGECIDELAIDVPRRPHMAKYGKSVVALSHRQQALPDARHQGAAAFARTRGVFCTCARRATGWLSGWLTDGWTDVLDGVARPWRGHIGGRFWSSAAAVYCAAVRGRGLAGGGGAASR